MCWQEHYADEAPGAPLSGRCGYCKSPLLKKKNFCGKECEERYHAPKLSALADRIYNALPETNALIGSLAEKMKRPNKAILTAARFLRRHGYVEIRGGFVVRKFRT